MKAINTIIILLVIAGAAIFAFYYLNPSQNPEQNGGGGDVLHQDTTSGSQTIGDSVLTEEQRQQQVTAAIDTINSAIVTADPSSCETINIEELKSECIEKSGLALALSENDPKKCEVLSSTGATECKDQIHFRLAQLSGKTDNCLEITNTGSREQCTRGIEIKILREKLRNNTENNTEKIDCDSFTNELAKEQCKADLQVANDNVIFAKAIESQSTENCGTIASLNLKQECNDVVYFSRAKDAQNMEICENIINNDTKEHCKSIVVDFSDSNLFEEAMTEQSLKICNKIQAQDLKQSCIDRIKISEIIKSGKKADCSQLSDVSLRTNCENTLNR